MVNLQRGLMFLIMLIRIYAKETRITDFYAHPFLYMLQKNN